MSATAISIIKTIEVGFLTDCNLLATAPSRLNGDDKYTMRSADEFESLTADLCGCVDMSFETAPSTHGVFVY
jgi:hypothetical protein